MPSALLNSCKQAGLLFISSHNSKSMAATQTINSNINKVNRGIRRTGETMGTRMAAGLI